MSIYPFRFRRFIRIVIASILSIGWIQAAPYGPDGMETEWTQPDGTKLKLRVFGDEFYGRTETLDGYTVVLNPATNSYEYADVSEDGKELVATNLIVGKGNPGAIGLTDRLDISPEARRAKAAARFNEWDKVTENSKRWTEIKAQRAAYEEAVRTAKDTGGPMPAPPSFTTVGNKKGLTLLIDFSDDPATIPQANIIDYCNGDNYTGYGNNGSVKKYFQDNSNNLLTYTNTVTAYIRMAQPKSYYNDTTKDNGTQGRLLIKDAIDILKALPNYTTEILPTFSDLTVDGSNRIVACNVLYAGGNGGVWSYGLWPHSWTLASSKELSAGGKKVFEYQITNIGSSLTLGTFCHENGHMLCGYPDIYDYDYDSKGGAGGFCLMNSGGHGTNPVLINAYLKRASGWTTTTDITSTSNLTGILVSTVGHADYNKIYRYANPAAPNTEYFLFENRQKTGRDANIAASGIAIWHIDQLGNHNNQSLASNTSHANYECSLIQADNLWHFQSNTNGGDSKDLYYLGNTAAAYTNSFSDTSSPDAKWWSGAYSNLNVYNFSSSGATMTLQFGLPPNSISVLSPNGGDQVYFAETWEIKWLSNVTGNVRIELFKGGSLHAELSTDEANDGTYSWPVPSSLPAGNDYTIKISSMDNPAYADTSNSAFSILTKPTLADALDTTGLTWTSSGNANWFVQSATTMDGLDAAQSGMIGDNQNTYMETTITGPGTLTFWWKVSSEAKYDFLRFYLNGTEQTDSLARISGSVNWTQKTVSIPSGSHTVKWGYTKDESVVSDSDAAWVDQVVYTPSAAPEIAVEHPAGSDLVDGSASVDLGFVNLSETSAPITITLKNVGAANLTGIAVSKNGANSDEFSLGSLGATTLAPGASTTFTVAFSPNAEGIRTAGIQIASNDANENPFDITVTGTCITVGALSVTPTDNLASTGIFAGPFSPSSQQYVLTNPGTTPIDWSAAKTASWVDLSSIGGTLAAGASTIVTVSINSEPNAFPVGNYTDLVVFENITNDWGDTTRGVSLSINPVPVTVTLGNLAQTYDGTPKAVSVTTTPPDLEYSVSYDDSAVPPTNAGTYAVTATVTTPNHNGSDSKDLVISKASQAINFAALDPAYDNQSSVTLTATATSGLTVSYTSSNPAVATVSGDTATIVGLGTTTITASQSGNVNYAAASSVPQILIVGRSNPLAASGGPYKVLFNQTLSLNAGASEPSYGETITSYSWDLNNDNIFGDITSASASISFADLTSPSLWKMVEGINPIHLQVTDSAGKISTASTTVEIVIGLTWDANGTATNRTDGAGAWLNAGQWWDGSSNQTWSSGSSANFGHGGAAGAVSLASPTTVNNLVFNAFSGTYTLGTSGQSLTLNGGITKNAGSGSVAVNSPMILGATQTWTNYSASAVDLKSTLDNGGYALTVDGAGQTIIRGKLSGAGGLTKNGTGVLSLSYGSGGNPTFGGPLAVNGGILQLGGSGSGGNLAGLPTGNITLNGGILEAYWSDTLSRSLGNGTSQIQMIGEAAGFSETGGQNLIIKLNNNTTTPIQWGTSFFGPTKLVLQTANGTGNVDFQNALNLNGLDRTVQVNAATATLSGVLSNNTGTAGLIKEGAGNLVLSNAANTYNGITTVNQGILTAVITGALPGWNSPGRTSVAAGAVLSVRTGSSWTAPIIDTLRANVTWSALTSQLGFDTTNGNFIYASNITETLSLIKSGNNTLTLTGNNSYTGTTRISSGTLVTDSANALGNGGDINFAGGTLQYTTNTASINYGSRIKNNTSPINLDTGGQSVSVAGVGSTNSGGLTKLGAGTLILSGTNSYTGATTLSGGTLTVLGSAALGTGGITWATNNTTLQFKNDSTLTVANSWSGWGTQGQVITKTLVVDRVTPGSAVDLTISQQPNTTNGVVLNLQKGSNITSGTPTVTFSAGLTSSDSNSGTLTGTGGSAPITFNPAGVNLIISSIGSSARTRGWIFQGDSQGNQVTGAIANGSGTSIRKDGPGTWTFLGANLHTGATNISDGTFKLGATGNATNTPLGTTAAGTIVSGTGTLDLNGFTLGAAEPLSLAGTGTSDNGALANSSTVAATFTGLITLGADAKIVSTGNILLTNTGTITGADFDLTLDGNATESSIASIIGTGSGAVIKTGSGTWTLSGANTYTGETIINQGTLALGASNVIPNSSAVSIGNAILAVRAGFANPAGPLDVTQTGAINLGAGSTLAFANSNGTWAGTLSITGSFVPGSSLRFGTSNTGLSSAQLAKISAPGYGLLVLDENGFLNVDTALPTLISISDDVDGNPIPVGTTVSYTVTFSEDMESATVSVDDFGNAGTALVSIGSVIEASPGIFTIQATPESAGTLQLRINQSAVLADLSGNNLDTTPALLDDTTITVQTAFESWAESRGLTGGDALPTSNPDGDAWTNLQEFAFDTSPTVSASGSISYILAGSVTHPGSPVAQNLGTDSSVDYRAVFGRRKNHVAAGLDYTVQFSADLTSWTTSDTSPTVLTGPENSASIEAVSVPYPLHIPTESGPKKPNFFRVGVSNK